MSQQKKILRINRLLSERGLASRRGSEKAVLEGRVKVNGKVVRDLSAKFAEDVQLSVDGKELKRPSKHLYLFHKPRNVVTTLSDPEGRPSVADYITKLPVRVFPIGRLDFDVSGLLLLTNDGELAQSLLHPKFEEEREYIARVRGEFTSARCKECERGLGPLDSRTGAELFKAKSCEILKESKETKNLFGELKGGESLVKIIVCEGQKHYVKELLKRAGNPVVRLSRIRFGSYLLGRLAAGEIREIGV